METDNPSAFAKSMVDQTLGITHDQLVQYGNAVGCTRPCAACGAEAWKFGKVAGQPVLLRSANVRDDSLAEWHFQMICQSCGTNRLISASYVWAFIFGSEAQGNE